MKYSVRFPPMAQSRLIIDFKDGVEKRHVPVVLTVVSKNMYCVASDTIDAFRCGIEAEFYSVALRSDN
jgi:hypothetical protein